MLLIVKCVFWFSLQSLFEIFFILRRIRRGSGVNVNTASYKVAVILDGF